MPNKNKSVVITGGSTGIGYASAKLLTKAGFRVFGSLRKDEDARRLSSELGPNFNPLMFDVTDEKAVKVAAARVRSAQRGNIGRAGEQRRHVADGSARIRAAR